MRFVDEFRDPELARSLVAQLEKLMEKMPHFTAQNPLYLMEVCGGHTHTIFKFGLDRLLPKSIEFIHGPGCPVCVLPMGRIDVCIEIALKPDVIFCTFGDAMMTASGMIGLAVESTCVLFAKKFQMEFGKVRQLADVVFIILLFICWFFFHALFPIREGTIILAFTFGPLLGYFTKKLQPRIHKWVYQTTN